MRLRPAVDRPCTLELGGKSPVVVTADANIPLTARRLALAKITNGGQVALPML